MMKKVNYPNNIKKNNHEIKTKINSTNTGNRGMSLEDDLNDTNMYYLSKDIAVIYKKPTPIQIVSTDYKYITKAFFKEPSTTDYNGIYKGRYIDFEAKETASTTNFPIKNIHPHQIKHLENIKKHEGIAFLIVRFTKLNKTYLLFAQDFLTFINNEERKSIPLEYFEKMGYLIKEKLAPRLNYIEIVEKYGGFYEEN